MNKGRRLVAGAAAACALVTPAAALADTTPAPAGAPDGAGAGGPSTTIPLPDAITACLLRNGFPALPPGTQFAVPTVPGAPPTSLTGTIPLPTLGVPGGTTTTTSAIPLPTSLPGGGATTSGGDQCGQIIFNNTVYLVTVTVTTTTTSANGPIAAGPVNVTGSAPAAAPVTTGTTPAAAPSPVATRRHATHRRSGQLQSTTRKRSSRRRAQPATAQGSRALHVVLVRKARGSASR
jgi:hypothetical protein